MGGGDDDDGFDACAGGDGAGVGDEYDSTIERMEMYCGLVVPNVDAALRRLVWSLETG